MPSTYRIYSVSERDVITGAFDHEFACDEDAVDQARCYLAAYPVVEIWEVDRMVDRLERAPFEAAELDGGIPANGAFADGGPSANAGGEPASSRPAASCANMDVCDDCSLLQEADHRIANHLSLIMANVRSKAIGLNALGAEPTREDARLMLDDVNIQIGAVSRLHRRLTGEGRCAAPDLSQELQEMCTAFRLGLAGAVEVLEDLQPDCVVEAHQLLPLVRCVAEVVVNAVKYAHPNGEPGEILVRCREDDAGSVWVEVIDDGVGLPESFDPDTDGGLGFRLVRELGRKLGALVVFESSGPGLTFRLGLPAA